MPDAPRRTHSVDRKTRSDFYLAFYLSLGESRTVRSVSEMGGRAGIPVTVRTLEKYSADYGWVDAAHGFDARVNEARKQSVFEDALAVDQRHTDVAQVMQTLGLLGAQALQAQQGGPGLSGSDVKGLLTEGVKTERLVRGGATEIVHMLTGLYDALGTDVARYYQQALEAALGVLLAEVPEERRDTARQRAVDAAGSIFGPGMDRMQQEHFRALAAGDVQIVDS